MTSVDILELILQNESVETAAPNEDHVSDIDNLKKLVTENKHETSLLLELIKSEALNSRKSLPSEVDSLTGDELFFLSGRFEEYQNQLHIRKQKLEPIENVLAKFNGELTELSSSLVSLHEKSYSLSSSLDSQKTSAERLNPIILDLMIPPDVAKSVLNGQVDLVWLENLRFINEKSQLIENLENGTLDPILTNLYQDSMAFTQLKQGLECLTFKAVERIRDFIIAKIKLLRSSTNKSSQTVQLELLNVKEAFSFLKNHHPKLADQLQLAYLYTMKWYYQSRFAKYLYALEKLHLHHIDSNMTLGSTYNSNEEKLNIFGGGLKNWIYSGSNTSSSPQTSPNISNSSAFQSQLAKLTLTEYLQSIDKRLEILQKPSTEGHKTAIPAQIAETTPFNYWLEFIFHQYCTALLDNVIVEYLFVIEFFYQGKENIHKIELSNSSDDNTNPETIQQKDWALLIFEDVYKLGKEFVIWLITHQPSIFLNNRSGTYGSSRSTSGSTISHQGTCDAYALLLMIRIIQSSQVQLHNEFHIPVLEDHLNSMLLLLWPHFTRVIDLNCESMRRVAIRAERNSNLAPAVVTQQFGQFLLGLLKLSTTNYTDDKAKNDNLRGEPLATSITRLCNDFENTLTKLSNHQLGSQKSHSTEKEIFLYNNYFLIVNILKNENEHSYNDFIKEQIDHFVILCDAYKSH